MVRCPSVLVAICLSTVVAGSLRAQAGKELEGLKFKFEVAREHLHKPVETLREQYKARVARMAEEYAAGGDLAGAVAARDAAASDEDPDPSELDAQPTKLANVQRLYVRAKAERSRAELLKLVPLHKSYAAQLKGLQSRLTMAGEIDRAVAVGNELEKIADNTLRLERQTKIDSLFAATGRFYSYIDDTASFYINGERVHRHGYWGKSKSRPIRLRVGDCVVFSARNIPDSPKHFKTVFVSEDGAYVVSFRARDFRVLPDKSKLRVLSRDQFERLEERAGKRGDGGGLGIDVEHSSETVWADGNTALLAVFITPDMITALGK